MHHRWLSSSLVIVDRQRSFVSIGMELFFLIGIGFHRIKADSSSLSVFGMQPIDLFV